MEALVIATNRPERFKAWLKAWWEEIDENDINLLIMHDSHNSEETDVLDRQIKHGSVFDHNDVKEDLKGNAWIIPQQSSACKSYAILKAWQMGADRIFCLDDDCLPNGSRWVRQHRINLKSHEQNQVYMTIDYVRPRGVPYLPKEPVMLSHGLWDNVPDVDAVTQLHGYPSVAGKRNGAVPKGALFPFCGMNWACNRDAAPLMYFGLHGKDWPVDRFDDIWCGFIAKKIMDHLGWAVWSGEPSVEHSRASDPMANLEKEAKGLKMNCEIYEMLMHPWKICGDTPSDSLALFGKDISTVSIDYWKKYGEALQIWASLF